MFSILHILHILCWWHLACHLAWSQATSSNSQYNLNDFHYSLLNSGFECLWCTSSLKEEIYLGIAYSPNNSYAGKFWKIIKVLERMGWNKDGFLKYVREAVRRDTDGGGAEDRVLLWEK